MISIRVPCSRAPTASLPRSRGREGSASIGQPCSPINADPLHLRHFCLANPLNRSPVRSAGGVFVEDSGFGEDLGVYSAPDLPQSPFLPRSFSGRRTISRLRFSGLTGI